MNDRLDHDIQKALAPSATLREPSPELMRRLRLLARESAPKPRWRARLSIPAAMAGVAVAAVIATTLLPARASAKSFGLIVAAAQRIDAFQFSIVSNEDAKHETLTVAGRQGHVVMRTDDRTVIEIDAGAMSLYDPQDKRVMRFKFGSLTEVQGVAKEVASSLSAGLKEMDLKKTLSEYGAKYGPNGIRVSPVTTEDGRSVYHVTLATPDQPERVEMTVDAASDLPQRLRVETREGDRGWQDSVTMEMRFGDRVDPRLLESSIPKDASVETIDLGGMVDGALKGLKSLDPGQRSGG